MLRFTSMRGLLQSVFALIILQNVSRIICEKSIILTNYCSKFIDNYQNCDCYPILATYEVNCPSVQPKLLMRIKTANYVQMECKKMENYELIPLMHLNNTITKMNIRYCPVPSNYSIATMLKQLNIEKLENLSIELDDTVENITANYFQDLTHLNDLHLKISALTVMSADVFSYKVFHKLHNLILNGNEGILPNKLLKNMENLHSLMLTTFKQIPDDIFHKLYRLNQLRMINNHFECITKDLFKDNENLYDLDLRNNRIKIIEDDSFKYLINLQQLTLKGNLLQNLPKQLFEYNKKLMEFTLSYCGISGMKSLPDNLLANLSNLKRIVINCHVKVITENLLTNSTLINHINLAFNKLEVLPNTLFETQYNLMELDLSNNHLNQLPDAVFKTNLNLINLNLSYNRLNIINGQVFSALGKLQHLDISHNNLIHINTCAFQNNLHLKDLYLNNNYLTLENSLQKLLENHNVAEKMASPFGILNELKHLDLSHNFIRYIYEDWKLQLPKLRELNLSNNNITSVDLNRLHMIKEQELRINLQHNQLKRLSFRNLTNALHKFQFKHKIFIDLNYNAVQCNCRLLDFVTSLNYFTSNEKIKLHLHSLQCSEPVNLRGRLVKNIEPKELLCPLENSNGKNKMCPNRCQCLVRPYDLTLIIDCKAANLTQFPELISTKKVHLKQIELYLDNNHINTLPKNNLSSGYNDIIKLSLSYNNLIKIENQHLPKQLEYLDLRQNHLKSLNISTLTLWHRFKMSQPLIYLSQNPWQCDCKSKEFLQMIQENYRLIHDLDNMTCSMVNNGNMTQRYFTELTVMELCQNEYKDMIIIITCLIAALIISLFGIFYYKYNEEIKIWLYAHDLCLRFVTEEDIDKHKLYDAFISYSHKDREFIGNLLVPQLEGGTNPYKLCVHVRDFEIGRYIPEQIFNAIDNSRRVIIVLSPNFIQSKWSRLEFREAQRAALNERRSRVIIILYRDLSNIDMDNLDTELKAYLKMNTYLKWGDPCFWDKLRYAMPHRTQSKSTSTINANAQ